jgi:hypothetical protein
VLTFEWKEFKIVLHVRVGPFTANQSLSVKDGVFGVRGELILCRVTNQTFSLGREGHVGGRDSISLIVGDNFHSTILKHTHTRVRGAWGGREGELVNSHQNRHSHATPQSLTQIDTNHSAYILLILAFFFGKNIGPMASKSCQ